MNVSAKFVESITFSLLFLAESRERTTRQTKYLQMIKFPRFHQELNTGF